MSPKQTCDIKELQLQLLENKLMTKFFCVFFTKRHLKNKLRYNKKGIQL